AQAREFLAKPHSDRALRVRRWDDVAKVAGAATRPWRIIWRSRSAARSPRILARKEPTGMTKAEKHVTDQASVLEAIRNSASPKVKVAVSDIDGVLRGKYIHKDKFFSAVEGGFGFCDVVFGWDMTDEPYDNTQVTGWHKGFPDAMVRLDLGTHR